MGCGCGGNRNKNKTRQPASTPKIVTNQSIRQPIQSQGVSSQGLPSGLSSDRRTVERQRREILLRKLGKI